LYFFYIFILLYIYYKNKKTTIYKQLFIIYNMKVRILTPDLVENKMSVEILSIEELKIKQEALVSTKILIKTIRNENIKVDTEDVLYMSDLTIIKKPIKK